MSFINKIILQVVFDSKYFLTQIIQLTDTE